MTIYERIEHLRKEKKLSQGKLEKELGFSNGSVSKWKNSTPTPERLQKIADYFGVTVDYLITGQDDSSGEKVSVLTAKDNRDIAKDLDSIMEKLSNKEAGPASYNGENLSEESMDLFREEIEIALKRLKLINKEKYNPNKNKK